MVRTARLPVVKQVILESLLGRRGVVKTANLWLPLALLVVLNPELRGPSDAIICVWLFLAAFCWAEACILGNDLSDSGDDEASGKLRWIARMPAPAGGLVVVLLSLAGLYFAYMAGRSLTGSFIYVGALALGLFYSFRPVRLKERGATGLWAYSFSAMLAFAVMPWVVLGCSNWATLAVLMAAVFFDKWTNLHFHQLIDYEADHTSGARTYAVSVGEAQARKTLRWAAAAAILSLTGVLVLVAFSQPAGWLFSVLSSVILVGLTGLYVRVARRKEDQSSLMRELPWLYLALTYSVLRVLPVLLLFFAALSAAAMWTVLALMVCILAGESLYSFRYRYD